MNRETTTTEVRTYDKEVVEFFLRKVNLRSLVRKNRGLDPWLEWNERRATKKNLDTSEIRV